MSKLAQIRKALQENSDIVIVGNRERNHLPHGACEDHVVDFYVAPKSDGVYIVKELQALMMSLVPGLELTCKDDFEKWDGNGMSFGKLYFDECIGMKATCYEITLTDDDIFFTEDDGFVVDGKRVIEYTSNINRRTLVRLFPNIQIAIAALEDGRNEYKISGDGLARHRKHRGFITRFISAWKYGCATT